MTKVVNIFLIIAAMVVIPYTVGSYAPLFVYLFSLISLLGICFKIEGAEFILIAISLCLPSGWVGNTGMTFPEIDRMFIAFNQSLYIISIISVSFFGVKSLGRIGIVPIALSLVLIGIFISLNTGNINEFMHIWTALATGFCFLLICLKDKKTSLKDVFVYIDVLFVVTTIYAVLDFFFNISPYHSVYDTILDIRKIIQAKGLLGNALYLAGIALFYQACLYVRMLLTKKIYYVQEFFCVVLILISLSRTAIIVFIVEYLLYLYIIGAYKKTKLVMINVFVICILVFLIFIFADSIVADLIVRFTEGSFEHRESAYVTVFSLFFNNPFGVGFYRIMESIRSGGYAAQGFSDGFSTVDNFFLTEIASYGLFAFFTVFYYYFFLIRAFVQNKKKKRMLSFLLLIYVPLILQSFSYDWQIALPLCLFLYGFIGHLIRECEKVDCCNAGSNHHNRYS